MLRGKKQGSTQTGGPATTLIGIITLIFIFYILFLPPEERRELLEGENYTSTKSGRILLSESPGLLTYTPKTLFDHTIPNIYLSETKNAVVLSQENPFIISKGFFGEKRKTLVFSIPDLSQTDSVVLSVQALERKGTLQITLNGQLLFESEVAMQNLPPIILPKTLLATTNQIEFKVTGPFLTTKKYSFSDVKVIGELTESNRQISTNTFTLSETEADNIDTAFLDFYPICEQREVGTLTIEVNGKTVHSAIPSCESLNRQDLDKEELREGKNTAVFKVDKGSYRVEQIRVRTILKPVKSFVDYFEINSTLYEEIRRGDRDIKLYIEFVDDQKNKQARLSINGKYDIIDQKTPKYEKDITNKIREENNYIELSPLTELRIANVRIKAE